MAHREMAMHLAQQTQDHAGAGNGDGLRAEPVNVDYLPSTPTPGCWMRATRLISLA